MGVNDNSTWDQIWLRIDWAGDGIEALITDINLSRARVRFPVNSGDIGPDEWIHIAVCWEENWGLKLYFNGRPAAQECRPAQYAQPLSHFGPHGYIISGWNVESQFNFTRGGDVCGISVFDNMLTDDQIALLAEGKLPEDVSVYEGMLTGAFESVKPSLTRV